MVPTLRSGQPEEAGMSSARLRRLAAVVRRWVDGAQGRPLVVLVARRGIIVWHEAFGRMPVAAGGDPTPLDAVFELMSVTKPLTATALMTLVDDGRVGLNRPVDSYIPEFAGEGKHGVRVRDLLTHTSGLRDPTVQTFAREHSREIQQPPVPDNAHPVWWAALNSGLAAPLATPPGVEMAYCGFNFTLAAEIVRRVSGMPLDRFATERIFRPLGMRDSSYCLVDIPPTRRVGFQLPADYVPDASDVARETERYWAGSWGALSSARDLAIFAQMFLDGGEYRDERVHSSAAVRAMVRNQTRGIPAVFFDQHFPESSWGLGWGIEAAGPGWNGALCSPTTFGHIGNGGTHLWADPARELVVAFLSSTPIFATDADITTANWARDWRNDLFADAVEASIEED